MRKGFLVIIMIFVVGLMAFILLQYGPFSKRPNLNFIQNVKINLDKNKDYHAIEFIASHQNIEDIAWPTVKKELGKQVLIYKVVGKDKTTKVFSLEIEMVDNTAPNIEIKNQELTFEYEENIPTEFNSLFTVNDNFDGNEQLSIQVTPPTNYIVGENKVKIKACDYSENCTENEITVIKKEKKQAIVEKVESTTIPTTNYPVPTQNQSQLIEEQSHRANQPINKPGAAKQFLFERGYNMSTVSDACENYLNQFNSGGCYPIKDASGKIVGMEYRP